MIQIAYIVCVIVFALLLGFIARKRGANSFFWTVAGGIFGPFAIPFVFFARRHNQKKVNPPYDEKTS